MDNENRPGWLDMDIILIPSGMSSFTVAALKAPAQSAPRAEALTRPQQLDEIGIR